MSLSSAFLDQLRERTLLSSLIGKSVKLTRAGREWRACCPFHDEKTPSFYVNDAKGFYHCFGCSAHGDAIRWMTDQRGLPFMDAVKELANAAGIDVPAPDPREAKRQERAAGLHDSLAAAERWFIEQLNGVEGGDARAYLKKRNISTELAQRFGIGFAPDSRGRLRSALAEFGDPMLIEAGLLIAIDGKEPYDRFRGRLMIPIRDPRGRTIGFGGRILGQGEPKYLNSPDTPLFDKGRTLWNLDKAASAARKAGRLIVVEGYMDAIALAGSGVDEVVAPNGTALTEAQIERLWRVVETPILCFDGDAAGQKAAFRAAERALPLLVPGYSLAISPMPPGQDPDDVIRREGVSRFLKFIEAAEPLSAFYFRTVADLPSATPEQRAGIRQRLEEAARGIQDRSVSHEYQQTFRDLFFERFGFGRKFTEKLADAMAAARETLRQPLDNVINRAILLGLMRYSDVLIEEVEAVARLPINDEYLKNWRRSLVNAVYERDHLDEDALDTILERDLLPPPTKRSLLKDLAYSFFYKKHERGAEDLRQILIIAMAEAESREALAAAQARLDAFTTEENWAEAQERRERFVETVRRRNEWIEEHRQAA